MAVICGNCNTRYPTGTDILTFRCYVCFPERVVNPTPEWWPPAGPETDQEQDGT